jgi:putative membrane protein
MQDLILAMAHHLAVFSLVAVYVAELVIVRQSMSVDDVRRVANLDALYGILAGLVALIGAARVAFGGKGWLFYQTNPIFWLKIGLFVIVGLLSVPPTLAYIAWRRQQRAEPEWVPSAPAIAAARGWLLVEGLFLTAIPLAAAAMARYPF